MIDVVRICVDVDEEMNKKIESLARLLNLPKRRIVYLILSHYLILHETYRNGKEVELK